MACPCGRRHRACVPVRYAPGRMRGCCADNGSGENLHSKLAIGDSRDTFAALGVGASVAKKS